MKKILIIILFVFLLCSCNKKEDLMIGVSRINETKICEEYCSFDLKVISSKELESMSLENIDAEVSYDYQIKKADKEIRIADALEEKIYSYDLTIKVFGPVMVNNIQMAIDNESYTFDVGTIRCLEKSTETSNHIETSIVKDGNLLTGSNHHKINIVNKSDRPIIVSDVKLKDQVDSNILVCQSLKDNLILSNKTKEMANCYIDVDNGLYSINYLLEVSYIYEGKIYETFLEVNDSSVSNSVSDLGSYLVVDRLCFVLNE